MNKFVLPLFALLVSTSVYSGNIADIFGKDIFGVPWGSSLQTVKSRFPSGKKDTQVGTVIYTIKDGRDLFGIKREPDNYIQYHFDAEGGINGVAIQFPLNTVDDYGVLLNKLSTHFGRYESVPNSFGVNYVRWPEEAGITIGLSHTPGTLDIGELLFGIEYRPTPASTTREELGF